MSAEVIFIQLCQQMGLPTPKLEHRFVETRKFRFDFAFPEQKLALEKEGGIWRKGGGAHSHPMNIVRDIEKYNLASSLGWRILRVPPEKLLKIETIELIKKSLEWKTVQTPRG